MTFLICAYPRLLCICFHPFIIILTIFKHKFTWIRILTWIVRLSQEMLRLKTIG